MIRFYPTLIFIFCFSALRTQTEALEKQYLNSLVSQVGNIPTYEQTRLRSLAKAWSDLLADFGGYPSLPYNEMTNQLEFSYVLDFPGISKEIIFTRIKEWIAINYGSIGVVLHYEDLSQGKLIAKGYSPMTVRTVGRNYWGAPKGESIDHLKCFYTAIYTVKDYKLKIEYHQLEYESSYYSVLTSNFLTSKQSVTALYPVTAGESDTWKSRLSTLQETDKSLSISVKSQEHYVKQFEIDYKF